CARCCRIRKANRRSRSSTIPTTSSCWRWRRYEEELMESQMRSRVVETDAATDRAYLTRVYGWMTAALAVTGFVAMLTAQSEAATRFIFANRGVFFGLLIGELLLVMVLAAAVHKMSATLAMASFMVYAAVNGLTLSAIFFIYTKGSIATT